MKVIFKSIDKNVMRGKIIKFFQDNPYPEDKDVHNFSKKLGIEPDELESHIYSILSSFLSEGKSMSNKKKYDAKELSKGIKVEKEHTSCPVIAEKIAKDHLTEIPGTGNNDGYYSLLDKMEKKSKGE